MRCQRFWGSTTLSVRRIAAPQPERRHDVSTVALPDQSPQVDHIPLRSESPGCDSHVRPVWGPTREEQFRRIGIVEAAGARRLRPPSHIPRRLTSSRYPDRPMDSFGYCTREAASSDAALGGPNAAGSHNANLAYIGGALWRRSRRVRTPARAPATGAPRIAKSVFGGRQAQTQPKVISRVRATTSQNYVRQERQGAWAAIPHTMPPTPSSPIQTAKNAQGGSCRPVRGFGRRRQASGVGLSEAVASGAFLAARPAANVAH